MNLIDLAPSAPTTPALALNLDWTADAVCGDEPDDFTWFSDDPDAIKEATTTCAGCPVRAQCLEVAMEGEADTGMYARYGIFGGHTPNARWDLHQARRRAA